MYIQQQKCAGRKKLVNYWISFKCFPIKSFFSQVQSQETVPAKKTGNWLLIKGLFFAVKPLELMSWLGSQKKLTLVFVNTVWLIYRNNSISHTLKKFFLSEYSSLRAIGGEFKALLDQCTSSVQSGRSWLDNSYYYQLPHAALVGLKKVTFFDQSAEDYLEIIYSDHDLNNVHNVIRFFLR